MRKVKLEGMIPPILTPFDAEGNIDEKLLRAEMEHMITAGVHGLSVSGSTGEGPTIRDEELPFLIKTAREYVKDEQPVVCGIMRTCTRDAVRAGLIAKEAGADALMVTPTAYNVLVPDEEGMFAYYSTLSEKCQMPIIIYNVIPQNTVMPGLFKRLVKETEWVKYIKSSVGSIPMCYAMVQAAGTEGKVFGATDEMLCTCLDVGAIGAISAVVAAFPELTVEMWNAYHAGNRARAVEIQNEIYPKWLCIGGNQFPIRLKYAMKLMGQDVGYCRSPIVHLSEAERHEIEKAFQ